MRPLLGSLKLRYMVTTTNSDKFKISLRQNGTHSLWKGIESFTTFQNSQKTLLLKDSIMFLHHGVELLMKEILIQHSPFLIFEDLKDAAKKQKQADECGKGIFFLDKPPRTVTFEEAINRVVAFVKPKELSKTLIGNLFDLNRLRNQLEHYALEVELEKIVRLLDNLHNPLLSLFDETIGDLRKEEPERVKKAWKKVRESAEFYNEIEKEVYDLISRIDGQIIPGELLGKHGETTLPHFTKVSYGSVYQKEKGKMYEMDICAEGTTTFWIIDVTVSRLPQSIRSRLDRLFYLSQSFNAQAWLVIMSELAQREYDLAKADGFDRRIFITDLSDWKKLKDFIICTMIVLT